MDEIQENNSDYDMFKKIMKLVGFKEVTTWERKGIKLMKI